MYTNKCAIKYTLCLHITGDENRGKTAKRTGKVIWYNLTNKHNELQPDPACIHEI